jgi:hypothetical protein
MPIKLGTKHPWMKGIQICTYKGLGPLQRGDNYRKGAAIEKSSQEPLSQKSSDLQESFQTSWNSHEFHISGDLKN